MTVLSGSISPQMGGAIRVPIDIDNFRKQCDLRSALALNVGWHISGTLMSSLIILPT